MPSVNSYAASVVKMMKDGNASFESTYTKQLEGVYAYDNTMKPMSQTQNGKSNGASFPNPSIKSPMVAGSRTFI